jgi:NADPH:quinone reductase-like Zn-dependent oxidoreductase
MRVFEVRKGSTDLSGLVAGERPTPEPGPGQVRVRVRAASLNFRDLAIASGQYFAGPVGRDTIPLSDGAGEVEALGAGVTGLSKGDRVAGTFFQRDGAALGSPLDGMLAEFAILDADGLVNVPEALSFEQAATLPCAGVTAWHALTEGRPIKPGDTVLIQGTGGVSIFGLQIAKLSGARVIVTSSSDAKLARARELGADETINYGSTPNWAAAVLELTGGRGVDQIVEVGGAGTLPQSYLAIGATGEIAMIGVLTPPSEASQTPHAMMAKRATLRGIYVGERAHFESLNRAIVVNGLEPVVDRVFDFDAAPDAYEMMMAARHFGKLVVRI